MYVNFDELISPLLTLLLLQQRHQTNSQPMLQLVKRGYHSNSLELKKAERKKKDWGMHLVYHNLIMSQ